MRNLNLKHFIDALIYAGLGGSPSGHSDSSTRISTPAESKFGMSGSGSGGGISSDSDMKSGVGNGSGNNPRSPLSLAHHHHAAANAAFYEEKEEHQNEGEEMKSSDKVAVKEFSEYI